MTLASYFFINMKNVLLVLILISVSAIGATAICNKILADHSHSDLTTKPTGIFDMGHSGGLDRNGGHHDRQNGGYHYHR
jgi:hypothetical protein